MLSDTTKKNTLYGVMDLSLDLEGWKIRIVCWIWLKPEQEEQELQQ